MLVCLQAPAHMHDATHPGRSVLPTGTSFLQGAASLGRACTLCLAIITLLCSTLMSKPEQDQSTFLAVTVHHACNLHAAAWNAEGCCLLHTCMPREVVAECSFSAAVRATAVDPLLSKLPSQVESMTSTELKATLQQVRACTPSIGAINCWQGSFRFDIAGTPCTAFLQSHQPLLNCGPRTRAAFSSGSHLSTLSRDTMAAQLLHTMPSVYCYTHKGG